jgi:hypothetical protein
MEIGGVVVAPIGQPAFGGSCEIFAAAGTYTVSVQFKGIGSTSVSVSNRKLWVQVLPFA